MYLVLFPEVGQAFKGEALGGWRAGWGIVGLGLCISRCLSRCLGICGWTWDWQGSPYVGCQFWGYSCAPSSILALRMEAGKLGPSHPSAPSLC